MKSKRYWEKLNGEWVKKAFTKTCDVCEATFSTRNFRQSECTPCLEDPTLADPVLKLHSCMRCGVMNVNYYKCRSCMSFVKDVTLEDVYLTGE